MKATINGIQIEGTKEEVLEAIKELQKEQHGYPNKLKEWAKENEQLSDWYRMYFGTGNPIKWNTTTCSSTQSGGEMFVQEVIPGKCPNEGQPCNCIGACQPRVITNFR